MGRTHVRTLSICAACALVACGGGAAMPLEVKVTQPAAASAPVSVQPPERETPVEIAPPVDADPELPQTWSDPEIPTLGFADAMKRARDARDAFARLSVPKAADTSPPDPQIKAWFIRAELLVDQGSRMYAAAFHATDAPRDGRIDAIAEAAEMDASFTSKLDEVGIITMPKEWRSDPSVKATFEDVANGPLRRWRDEARGLAKRCVDVSRSEHVTSDAARRCASLRITIPSRVAKQASPCGCVAGDPMCSASLGGWCPPPRQ